MKLKGIILAFIVIGIIISCDKNEIEELQFESTGIIMGSDKGACPCCGGWILEIDDDDKIYRFENLPQDAEIELSETPTSVKFDWSVDRKCGDLIYLDIESIELN